MKNNSDDHTIKPYRMEFRAGRPMEMVESDEVPLSISDEQRLIGKALGPAMRSYIDAAAKLLQGKLSNIRDYAPPHLLRPRMLVVFCCKDGVIIRYDSNTETEKPRVGIAYSEETLSDIVPKISESVVHCYMSHDAIPAIPESGPEITFTKTSGKTGESEKLFSFRINYNIVIEKPSGVLPSPPSKPYCLFSVRNSLEIMMEIETVPTPNSSGRRERFITRSPLRLPVGWECIEIFPFVDPSHWNTEYAYFWAENDILASVVTHHQREAEFNTLDPNAAARRNFSKLLQEYKQLLDSEPKKEELLQNYLKQHPELLCPAQVRMWTKLALGSYETDFVFQEASGDYLLVELEKSTDRLFIRRGDRSSELKHAQDQITDWKRYIADNLPTVRTELNLTNISSNPRSLLVIGRSRDLSPQNRQILQAIENDSPKNKIMPYDDLYENTKAIIENYFGPLWVGFGNTQIYALPNK